MQGDPDGAALGEARLVVDSCEDNERATRALVRARIAQMRDEVDEEFRNWRSLPLCPWLTKRGQQSGESFGAGGLGLSGVGEGGGGRGEGIGLGSIGTVGHGFALAGKAPVAKHHSGTNNQVEGVDEADFVKNDGRYVYLALNGALRIVDAESLRVLSVTQLPGDARQMLVEGDRVAVLAAVGGRGDRACTYGYDCQFGGDGSGTKIEVLDVADRAHPRVVREIELSGSLIAARRIANAVHVVVGDGETEVPYYATSPDDLPYCHENEPVVHAQFERLKRDNERILRAAATVFPTVTERGATRKLCSSMHTALGDGRAFTTIVSFDLRRDGESPVTATVQSRPGAVYASEGALYLSVLHERSGGRWYRFSSGEREVSDVHKFRIGASPSDTHYVGSGVVPGHVLNQFSVDEWSGYLRVATSRGRVPDPATESAVSILSESAAGNLVRVGAIEHIAPREDIRAVRFDGDRGYVVTFKKTDPLFVIDLYRADQPKILGELKIPGFSTYLHRIDRSHLLSIGFDARDHGDFAYFDGIILQLFDVTRPTEPRLLHKETIGTRGSSSEAATDHLAFNYFPDLNMLAIPITICEGGGDGVAGDRVAFSGLLVYDTTVEGGFRRLGGVDHHTLDVTCSAWWSHASSSVKRSIFIDGRVFSIASDLMKVQRLAKLGEDVASIALTP